MPIHTVGQLQRDDFHAVDSETGVAKAGKTGKVQKGTPSELISSEKGTPCNVNKSTVLISGKEKGKQTPTTGDQIEGESDAVCRRWADYETRQAQDRDDMVARAVPETSEGPSSRSSVIKENPAGSAVVPGETSTRNPQGMRSAANSSGISSAVQIRGSVLELASRIKGTPVRVLLDSGATGNFISDKIVDELRLKVDREEGGE